MGRDEKRKVLDEDRVSTKRGPGKTLRRRLRGWRRRAGQIKVAPGYRCKGKTHFHGETWYQFNWQFDPANRNRTR